MYFYLTNYHTSIPTQRKLFDENIIPLEKLYSFEFLIIPLSGWFLKKTLIVLGSLEVSKRLLF